MNPEETITRQESALNSHDSKAFAGVYTATAAVTDPFYPEPLKGREAIESDMTDFLAAFPDARFTRTKTMVNGDTVAYEGKFNGTHNGPLQGPTGLIPATNRPVEFKCGIFTRVDEQGAIIEERRYMDVAGIMAQLGLV